MSTQTANNSAMHGQTMQTKIERYGWRLVDSPGESTLIHKDKLKIDDSYQRLATTNKVTAIASKWSWIACGCLIVGHRNGLHYVIDGGHRVLAARSRSDIGKLPCIVFETEDVKQEAEGFLNANTQRRPMSAVEKFKALVIVGDTAACKINELLSEAKYTISASTNGVPRRVKCVRVLMDCYTANPDAFLKVWPLILQVTNEESISELVVAAIFFLECMARKRDADMTITINPWRKRLTNLGSEGVVGACKKAAAYYARGGMRVWAKGLQDVLNRGVQHRLDLINDAASRNGDQK